MAQPVGFHSEEAALCVDVYLVHSWEQKNSRAYYIATLVQSLSFYADLFSCRKHSEVNAASIVPSSVNNGSWKCAVDGSVSPSGTE